MKMDANLTRVGKWTDGQYTPESVALSKAEGDALNIARRDYGLRDGDAFVGTSPITSGPIVAFVNQWATGVVLTFDHPKWADEWEIEHEDWNNILFRVNDDRLRVKVVAAF